MIHDPKIQTLIAGGPQQFMTRRQRIERYLSWFLLAAVVLLTVGYFAVSGVAHQARSASVKAAATVQASCLFWHDLAALPIPAQPTPALLTIIKDARIAYSGLECLGHTGRLPAPDPRVAAILPPGIS